MFIYIQCSVNDLSAGLNFDNNDHFCQISARVMLIHAGGYSQRLPNQSILGKIFLTLPCGECNNVPVLDRRSLCCHISL